MVYVLTEQGIDAEILKHNKVINVVLKSRPTYSTFFEVINMFSGDDDWNIIANSDIHFDNTITKIEQYKRTHKPVCLALTRWEVERDKTFFLNRPDSQDTWIFQGKVRKIQGDFFMGTCGCLSGDTLVEYNRGKRSGTRKIKIKDLYLKRGFKKSIDTFIKSFDFKTKTIRLNKVNNVIQSGIKETIKIIFEDNTCLILTPDHRVLTECGWIEASNLKIGGTVISKNDNRIKKQKEYKERKVVYIKHHPFAENKIVRGHKYKRVRRYRLVYEAHMNKMDYDTYIYILNNDKTVSKGLKFLDPKIEVHHKDGNTTNDSICNLEIYDKVSHAKIHLTEGNLNRQKPKSKTIKSIEQNGDVMTYDITMDGSGRNFCANGIVVHNCDNAIADRLYRAGYEVLNPSKTIKTYHLHQSGVRHYNTEYKVPQPYKLLHPTA